MEFVEGDVRIKRNDKFGFVTQKLVKRDVFAGGGKGIGRGKPTGETKLEWEDCGYFSHVKGAARKAYALQTACRDLCDEGANGEDTQAILNSLLRLESRIAELVKEAMAEEKA